MQGFFNYINRSFQNHQKKKWRKWGVTTPYYIGHRDKRNPPMLDFVAKYHFGRYCQADAVCKGDPWQHYKATKRCRLYWRLHPEYNIKS